MDASTLRDRLRGIVKPNGKGSADTVVGSDFSRTSLDTVVGSDFSRTSLDNVLGGAWRDTPAGRSFVVATRFSPTDAYGSQTIKEFADDLTGASSAAALVGPAEARAPFVFFDL